MNVTNVTVTLRDDHLLAIDKIAAELGIIRSVAVEKAIRLYQLALWQAKSDNQRKATQ